MTKAEECLRQEEERVTKYLHVDSKPKLLKEVLKLSQRCRMRCHLA